MTEGFGIIEPINMRLLHMEENEVMTIDMVSFVSRASVSSVSSVSRVSRVIANKYETFTHGRNMESPIFWA